MSTEIIIPTTGRSRGCPLTLREKVELVARCKLRGEDPKDVVPPLYRQHGLVPPKYPAQALSGFVLKLRNLVAKDDAEALALAREFGFELNKMTEPVAHLG